MWGEVKSISLKKSLQKLAFECNRAGGGGSDGWGAGTPAGPVAPVPDSLARRLARHLSHLARPSTNDFRLIFD